MQEKILIIDFGSQYTQLIARRVRELSVYCEIHPFNHLPAIDASVRGVILSGSPFSVRDAEAPRIDLSAIKGRLPLLGVCYGAQYLAQHFGGEVTPAPSREYGRAMLTVVEPDDRLMEGLPRTTQVWMSHGDTITRVPDGYRIVASTAEVHVAAYRIEGEPTWAIQFHPEVYHSTDGVQLLRNFVVGICGCAQSWTSESFVETTVRELREKIGDDKVVLGLSGGVDSCFLAYAASRVEGVNFAAYYVQSAFQPEFELTDALRAAKEAGLPFKIISVDILACEDVVRNPTDRCCHCKKHIFSAICRAAAADGYKTILDGTNASDAEDDRPGMRALREAGVLSPLRECGLTKADIRRLAREAGLFTWNKPAYACLATRIPPGELITKNKLHSVEAAENFLFSLGFSDLRVRSVNGTAKLQLKAGQFDELFKQREHVLNELRQYFDAVTLDLEPR